MYSYADRLQDVELYIRLGKLGYLTKNAVKGWYREYVQHLDLRIQPVARAPKYSESQKQAALEHYHTHDRCISVTMRALGYPGRGTLTAWGREGDLSGDASINGWSTLAPWLFRGSPASRVIGLCNGDESAQHVADRLGVSRPTFL